MLRQRAGTRESIGWSLRRPADVPEMSTGFMRTRALELSSQRCSVLRDRDAGIPRRSSSVMLENCTMANEHGVATTPCQMMGNRTPPAVMQTLVGSPSRYKGHTVDALASGAEEGRGRLR
jgi:hypothetical protein